MNSRFAMQPKIRQELEEMGFVYFVVTAATILALLTVPLYRVLA